MAQAAHSHRPRALPSGPSLARAPAVPPPHAPIREATHSAATKQASMHSHIRQQAFSPPPYGSPYRAPYCSLSPPRGAAGALLRSPQRRGRAQAARPALLGRHARARAPLGARAPALPDDSGPAALPPPRRPEAGPGASQRRATRAAGCPASFPPCMPACLHVCMSACFPLCLLLPALSASLPASLRACPDARRAPAVQRIFLSAGRDGRSRHGARGAAPRAAPRRYRPPLLSCPASWYQSPVLSSLPVPTPRLVLNALPAGADGAHDAALQPGSPSAPPTWSLHVCPLCCATASNAVVLDRRAPVCCWRCVLDRSAHSIVQVRPPMRPPAPSRCACIGCKPLSCIVATRGR